MTIHKQQLCVLWARDPYSVPDFVSSHCYWTCCSWVASTLQWTHQHRASPEEHPWPARSACRPSLLHLMSQGQKTTDWGRAALHWAGLTCSCLPNTACFFFTFHHSLWNKHGSPLLLPSQMTQSVCYLSSKVSSKKTQSSSSCSSLFHHSNTFCSACGSKAVKAGGVCVCVCVNLSSSKDEICHRFSGGKTIPYPLP